MSIAELSAEEAAEVFGAKITFSGTCWQWSVPAASPRGSKGWHGCRRTGFKTERAAVLDFIHWHNRRRPHEVLIEREMRVMSNYEYWRAMTPRCPHCGAIDMLELDKKPSPSPDLFKDGALVHLDCKSCGKDFVVLVGVLFRYSSAVDETAAAEDYWGPREVS